MPSLPAWYCCLNPLERSVFRTTAEALLFTLFVGIPYDLWDSFWFASLYSGAGRRAAFLEIYALEIVTIVDFDTEESVVVVRPTDYAFWADATIFVLLPGAACGDGCGYVRFP